MVRFGEYRAWSIMDAWHQFCSQQVVSGQQQQHQQLSNHYHHQLQHDPHHLLVAASNDISSAHFSAVNQHNATVGLPDMVAAAAAAVSAASNVNFSNAVHGYPS